MPTFEYRDEDGELDPIDVSAPSHEDAVVLLRKAWADYIAKLKAPPDLGYDWSELEAFDAKRVRAIGDEELKFGPKPSCCKPMQRYARRDPKRGEDHPAVMLDVPYGGHRPKGGARWRLKGVPIKHCPWCGAGLPKVEKLKEPPYPTCKSRSGDYCDTCGERLMGCRCNHPAAGYRIIE